jgi:Ca-activated chloride channel family protein
MSQFHFLRPLWLLAMVPALGLALLLIRRGDREGNWARAVAPELLVHLLDGQDLKRSRHTVTLLLGAWCLAAIAAAGPSWQQLPRPVLQKQDALVIVMDLSYSMLATDLQPSRVDRMRRKLQDLLGQRREGLSALVAYAGDAHVVAPLTDDNRTIANLLPALDPSMMPVPGSNAPEALQRALDLLRSAGIRSGRVLLVTDGVADDDRDRLANMLLESSHRLAILGVGTEVGAPIPLPTGGFLKDDKGEIVVPPLTEPGLRDLAGRVNGAYRRMRVDDDDLTGLLSATASLLDEESINRDRDADEWQDMGHWFVLPLLLGCLLSFRRGTLYGLALLLMLPAPASRASLWDDLWQTRDQQAAEALAAGDAEKAADLFEAPQWRGTAAWETKDYEAAQEAFAAGSDADAWYNRGNALAAQGRLEEAIDAYQRSLTLAPGADDARRNIDTLKELLDQQQQEQQQEQQQQQQDQQYRHLEGIARPVGPPALAPGADDARRNIA